MNMPNQDGDWLDARMAVHSYIPDDGFTARVVGRLPKARPDAVGILRRRILFLSTSLASCLLAVQFVSLVRTVDHVATRISPLETMGQVAMVVQQPAVMYGGAACIILLGFASIPFLRRWV